VLTTQDTRHFVLGFTLCGSIMRLWEFDRLGGIASAPLDINKDGLQFVSTTLGYLRMTEEQLGFDPTIVEMEGKRYIDIVRKDQKYRIVLRERDRGPTLAFWALAVAYECTAEAGEDGLERMLQSLLASGGRVG
jgi:hypothetical protein